MEIQLLRGYVEHAQTGRNQMAPSLVSLVGVAQFSGDFPGKF
jgi:hypothetical protein